jgi:hypothetical protein
MSDISDLDKIAFVRKYCPEETDSECLQKYEIYQSYRSEGQSSLVSRQYAGMLVDEDY